MAEISKLSGVAIADVAKVDAVTKANIANINDLTLPSGFTGLLDTYTGAAAAYSVRRLSSSYTGACMRVREDGTNTETDIGFDSNGDLDTAAIATHCGANNGFVRKWYDQSQSGGTGSGNDADQATASVQPKIYNGTAVITENGKPALEMNGTYGHFAASWNIGTTSSYSGFHTLSPADTTGQYYIHQLGEIRNVLINGGMRFNVSLNGFNVPYNAQQQLVYENYASSGLELGFDGATPYTTGGPASVTSSTNAVLFIEQPTPRRIFNGTAQELIFYLSDESSNRTGIEGNINTYFSIF